MLGSTLRIGRALCIARSPPCAALSKRFYPAKRKRFYKTVGIVKSEGNFEICLDQRKLKTPLGNNLALPNEGLAVAVATEWDSQLKEINQHEMHLTALCNTVLDNPSRKTEEVVASEILEFLESDTLCYRMQEPEELAALQEQKWDPLLRWFEERHGVKLETWSDLASSRLPQATVDSLRRHLLSYSLWGLVGLQYATESLKSVVLCLAAASRFVDVDQAVALSRLETDFQTSHWGSVEWAHDLDREQLRSRVAAALLFVWLTAESSSSIHKGQATQAPSRS